MAGMRDAVKDALAAEIVRWGIKPEKLPAGEKHLAGLALDAVLDTLADRADEWDHAAMKSIYGPDESGWAMNAYNSKALIAVLRGDTE